MRLVLELAVRTWARLLGSRSGLKEGEFTGVSGYMFMCTNETENACLSQTMLMTSAKELRSLRRDVGPTTKLFLCNYDTGTVHGPWLPLGEQYHGCTIEYQAAYYNLSFVCHSLCWVR